MIKNKMSGRWCFRKVVILERKLKFTEELRYFLDSVVNLQAGCIDSTLNLTKLILIPIILGAVQLTGKGLDLQLQT